MEVRLREAGRSTSVRIASNDKGITQAINDLSNPPYVHPRSPDDYS